MKKHFTLNKRFKGPDHNSSLNTKELKDLDLKIRLLEKALGDGVKKPVKLENKIAVLSRKSWHASKKINKDEKFTLSNSILIRPEVAFQLLINIIGKTAKIIFLKASQ